MLVRIRDRTHRSLRQAVQAHAYWRAGVSVDLVIWNGGDSVYRQTLQDGSRTSSLPARQRQLVDKPGGIFVRRGEQMSEEDRSLLRRGTRGRRTMASLPFWPERRDHRVLIPALKPRAAGQAHSRVRELTTWCFRRY